jgi:hypothetical protein
LFSIAIFEYKNTILLKKEKQKKFELFQVYKQEKIEKDNEKTNQTLIHPEIVKIQSLLNEFEYQSKWDSLLYIGDVYRNGCYPTYLPNEDVALKCYQIASQCPNGNIAGLAQMKYIQTRLDPIQNHDKKGIPLPIEYGYRICDLAQQKIYSSSFQSFEKPRVFIPPAPCQIQTSTKIPIQTIQIPSINSQQQHIQQQQPKQTEYKSNKQNVHDHSVLAIVKLNFNKIKEGIHIKPSDIENITSDIIQFILENKEISQEQVMNSLEVLESLTTDIHTRFDTSERMILCTVWKRILLEKDETKRMNKMNTLIQQLASGIENDKVVCSTGKVLRIISVFEGIDEPDIQLAKPIWVVKEEIANTASKIRYDIIHSLSPSMQKKYEKENIPEIDSKMKFQFRKKITELYINELKMNKSVIEPIIELYENAF